MVELHLKRTCDKKLRCVFTLFTALDSAIQSQHTVQNLGERKRKAMITKTLNALTRTFVREHKLIYGNSTARCQSTAQFFKSSKLS